ncbi:MAG: S-layer homology domain-containing protein [Clostridiales bacterium]|nr:S-layer homology domain-containing protein [Clostridiales bacterium]
MKKVISFVLVLALVLGSFSMAFAVPADVEGTDCEAAVIALTELGVVTGYPDGTYKPANAVTRAEAAKLVVTALGLAEYAAGNTASFTDLEGYGWAKGYIGYAEALGILKGDGNGKFRPADTVSYQEMATMLVRACGYTDASLPGTWPANYVVKAKALGIMDGITQAGSAAANRGDVAVMIFNNLENRIGYVDTDNVWHQNTPVDTMMARLDQQLYDPDGVATAAAVGDAFILTEAATVAEGTNVKAYYGAYVVAYANADNEITGIKEVKSTFLTGEFKDGKFVADDVEYTVVTDNFGGQVVVFNNGETSGTAISNASAAADTEYTLAVKVSGKKINNIYSEAVWTGNDVQITNAMVKNIAENNKIANAYKFVEDDNFEIDTTTFVLVGVDALADIEKDDIVTVYTNDTNYVTKLEVSDKVVTGEITKKSSDAKEITVDGTVYAMNDGSTFAFVPGDEVELTLNYAGDVFAIDKVSGELANYGIVTDTKAVVGDWSSATTEYAIKFFGTDGTEKEVAIAEDTSDAAMFLTVGTVFKYDLNKDGEISGATVAAVTTGASVEVSAKGLLAGANITDNTIVILADGVNAATEKATEDFSIGKAADLYDADLTAVLYVVDEDTDTVEFMIVKSDSTTDNNVYGVVNEAFEDNSDAGYGVVVIADAKEATIGADASASSLIATTSALKIFKYNTDGTLDVAGVVTVTAAGTVTTSGYSITVNNGRLKATTDGATYVANYGVIADDVIVYVYDADNSVWTVGDITDVEVDLETGNEVTYYTLDSDNPAEITHITVF